MTGAWDGVLQDVRYSARSLAKSPVFMLVAVLSLALGIGANIAIFGFADAAILKPLAVERPDRLVSLYFSDQKRPGEFYSTSYPEFEFYREHNTVFSGMLAYLRVPMIAGQGTGTHQISGELVSPGYFGVLGIRPVAGRFFADREDAPEAVIGYQFWRDHFAGSRNVIGQSIHIGAGQFTVIGIAPETFRGIVLDWADPPSVWVPVSQYKQAAPEFPLDIVHAWRMQSYLVTARLRPGVTAQQASAQMDSLTARLRETVAQRRDQSAELIPLSRARFWPSYRGSVLTFLGVLMAIVGVILLIACGNLANLLLVRAAGRAREIAMRVALGAGRVRIARQLLIESLLLTAVGAAGAIAIAAWLSRFFAQFHRAFRIPLALDTGWDLRMMLFAIALSAVTALLFGAAPMIQASTTDLSDALKTGAAGGASPRSRLQAALLIGQVALATILLAGAGAFIQTLRNARAESPVQNAGNLLLIDLEPSLNGYTETRAQSFYSEALRRVRAVPGVKSAALVNVVPFSGIRSATNVTAPDGSRQQVGFNVISPDYFVTSGLPVLRGREFNIGDDANSPPAAVINDIMAERLWPGEDAVGRTLRIDNPARTVTIVGVVHDGKLRGYRDTLRPAVYLAAAQDFMRGMTLEVRTESSAESFTGAVRRAVHSIDSSMPLTGMLTMEARLDDVLSQERLIAAFSSGLAALAILLTAIGIYGVLSFAVTRRIREIGIRMALGARPGEVSRMVLRESAMLAGAGFVIGGAAAVMLARVASSLIYGVAPADPVTFGFALAAVAVLAAGSAAIPAYRASRLDPAATLRGE